MRRVIIFQVTSVVQLGEDGSMISTTKKVKGDIVVPVGIILYLRLHFVQGVSKKTEFCRIERLQILLAVGEKYL